MRNTYYIRGSRNMCLALKSSASHSFSSVTSPLNKISPWSNTFLATQQNSVPIQKTFDRLTNSTPTESPSLKSALQFYCKKFTKKGHKKSLPKEKKKKKPKDSYKFWVEDPPDIFWPTIPGYDGPEEESAEPVGNLNKPPPISPEEMEKYKNLYTPTPEEMYDQFQSWPPPEFNISDSEDNLD